MNILTDTDRAKLLERLVDAEDEVLLYAVNDMKRRRLEIQQGFDDVRGFAGVTKIAAPLPNVPPPQGSATPPAAVAAKTEGFIIVPSAPPGVASSRIGGETKDKIIGLLVRPNTATEVNKFLGRGDSKLDDTTNLLKRLWDLKLVTFDGTNYKKG